MNYSKFDKLHELADHALESEECKLDTYLIAYALYSLVDATSQIEHAIDDSTNILKKIEGHLHHMNLERWNK
tara:strand:+ start:235 stop:450 length:216 start_codon:yes stop_codon:yes gene_type:complete